MLRFEGRRVCWLAALVLSLGCGGTEQQGDGGSGTASGGFPNGGSPSGGRAGFDGAAGSGRSGSGTGGSATGGTAQAGAGRGGSAASGGAGGSGGVTFAGAGGAVESSGGAGAQAGGGALAGAGGLGGGGMSAGGGFASGGASSGGAPQVDFAAVQAIFDDRCVTCHDASKQGLPSYPMLPLTDGAAHDALVGVPADETCGGTRVVPGDPDASYLVQKLTQETPCNGARMPRPFEVGNAPPLTSDQLATIRAWIQSGAPGGRTTATTRP